MNEPAILELMNATVIKNDVRALDGVTLRIPPRQHTAIMGPNGAGKSALMQLITFQERPVPHADGSPSLRVLGRDLWHVFELRPRLGVVSSDLHHRFVNGNSHGRIRAIDAVLSGLFGMHGLTPPDAVTAHMREDARLALDRMDAAHLSSRFLDEMSTGEVRRVLVARALVTTPTALLLDEPAAGLDVAARHRLMTSMNRVAEAGTTLILVTHQVEEIVPAISHVVLLKDGRVVADGQRREVLTDLQLSRLFEIPVTLSEHRGYVQAVLA
ncbi:MAG: ATP-binding cassette domain-containing protein [Acidimicrobiia bacterium]|nr:ATP-binding cassette domain-containing protein [Acidimicrobiia bacterium]